MVRFGTNRGSNSRPWPYEADAVPLSLMRVKLEYVSSHAGVYNSGSQFWFRGNLNLVIVLPEGNLIFLHAPVMFYDHQMTSKCFGSGTHPGFDPKETPVSWAGINPFQTDLWWCKAHDQNHSWGLFPRKSTGHQSWFWPYFDTFCTVYRISHGLSWYPFRQSCRTQRAKRWTPFMQKTW